MVFDIEMLAKVLAKVKRKEGRKESNVESTKAMKSNYPKQNIVCKNSAC